VKLDGPFREAQVSRGNTIYSGKEYVKWEADVQKMEPQRLFLVHLGASQIAGSRNLLAGLFQ